jgi:2Fe-2S ferredoxin
MTESELDVPPPATRAFRVTFQPTGETIDVDPQAIPYGRDGHPGSILDIALGQGVDIDHACGGVCACSTCHVIVREGFDSCNEATEAEEDRLDEAPGLETESRLACQCVPDGSVDLVVEIPAWNRNAVREAPH